MGSLALKNLMGSLASFWNKERVIIISTLRHWSFKYMYLMRLTTVIWSKVSNTSFWKQHYASDPIKNFKANDPIKKFKLQFILKQLFLVISSKFQTPMILSILWLKLVSKHSHFEDASSLFWHFAKSLFSNIDVQCSDMGKIFIGDPWTILQATHFNYLTHKLCCLGTNLYICDTLQLSDTLVCFLWGQVCDSMWFCDSHISDISSHTVGHKYFCANRAPYLRK